MIYFFRILWIPIRMTVVFFLEYAILFLLECLHFLWTFEWDKYGDFAKIKRWFFWRSRYDNGKTYQFINFWYYETLWDWVIDNKIHDRNYTEVGYENYVRKNKLYKKLRKERDNGEPAYGESDYEDYYDKKYK